MTPHVDISADPAHPKTYPSVFDGLGGFIANASSFPTDGVKSQAFVKANPSWAAYQWGDPATAKLNAERVAKGDAERLRAKGIPVFGWHRVEHVPNGLPLSPDMDGWIANPETEVEAKQLDRVLAAMSGNVDGPLALITVKGMTGLNIDLVERYNLHILLECFSEDYPGHTVSACVDFYVREGVPLRRLHPCFMSRTGLETDYAAHMREAEQTGVRGASVFVLENTPVDAYGILEQEGV